MGNRVNGLMIASVTIHIFIALLSFIAYEPAIAYFVMFLVFANIIAFVCAGLTGLKWSYIFYLVTCIVLVPIGLIGAFGARKKLDILKRMEMGIEEKGENDG